MGSINLHSEPILLLKHHSLSLSDLPTSAWVPYKMSVTETSAASLKTFVVQPSAIGTKPKLLTECGPILPLLHHFAPTRPPGSLASVCSDLTWGLLLHSVGWGSQPSILLHSHQPRSILCLHVLSAGITLCACARHMLCHLSYVPTPCPIFSWL